ncbi:amylo-alpha-1,6-glucosidase [Chitinasiproducens palmae]|uniref:Glycogen debranching enzyme (Alpha-1,6-glucosidase) n=1 Tax=Chitinasiproducens palmae TaxID=1770053 RepID=A0A1H2PR81_9BURK|nr:glycogen debranching N-terminal domain-containing protein [Chitinasiproducens palmae]SDV49317.1 Glycogen debranching enzyme (alpha-1,6-glucosidase) [Chitinasiproducens palmae]
MGYEDERRDADGQAEATEAARVTSDSRTAPGTPASAVIDAGPLQATQDSDADGAEGVLAVTESAATVRESVLKSGDTFIVNDALGDIHGRDDGFFVNDTRVVSRLMLTIAGRPLSLLSGGVNASNTVFTAHLTNRRLPSLGDQAPDQGVLHIARNRVLGDATLHESITITNYGTTTLELPLAMVFDSDFRDMFEVRGAERARRGRLLPARADGCVARLAYVGLDGVQRRVRFAFGPTPDMLRPGLASYRVTLAPRATKTLYFSVTVDECARSADEADASPLPDLEPDAPPACGRDAMRAAMLASYRLARRRVRSQATVRTANPLFNGWLARASADLSLLTTNLPTGPYPYAGIPWFSTPFGRDGIITALQTLWLQPELARGVLSFLASTQAREDSAFRDAEVGKIMHETRKGEMAATGEVPFRMYYGGVDSTPLFIVLAGAYFDRTGDRELIDTLWPALRRATQWIARACDRNRFGLLSYARGAASGLANQGWKDSGDSVFDAEGRFPDGPIALIEVQGYACVALETMARLAATRDAGAADGAEAAAFARDCAARAATLRERIETMFWMPEAGFYGIAVDGQGALCRVRASNAGHLLAFGLPDATRGAAVATVLTSPAFDSGWGIRTLAAGEPRFNPMSYHNGSVWPHDTALCARGLARYGDKRQAARLLGAMHEAAVGFEMRLPELFCGFARGRGQSPTAYPVACLPQAWASGAPFMLLEACLGIKLDGVAQRILIERPMLPPGIERLHIGGLQLGQATVSLTFRENDGRVLVSSEGDDVDVSVRL